MKIKCLPGYIALSAPKPHEAVEGCILTAMCDSFFLSPRLSRGTKVTVSRKAIQEASVVPHVNVIIVPLSALTSIIDESEDTETLSVAPWHHGGEVKDGEPSDI